MDNSIALTPVESSNIEAIGYDASSETLRVQFKGSGNAYDYAGVPVELYRGLMQAESHGKYLIANIKGKYEGTRVHGSAT